jgi:sugar phosphate permease
LYFVWLKASSLVKPCAHIGSALLLVLLVLLNRSTGWTCAAYTCVAWWSKRDMEVLVSVSETSSEAYKMRVSGLAPRRCSDSASMSELHTWSGDVAYVT